MNKRIDNKFSITSDGVILNAKGIPVPDHEPKILFRGKDKLAIPMLNFYLDLCLQNGCTKQQEESLRDMIERFQDFQKRFPSTMKLPD